MKRALSVAVLGGALLVSCRAPLRLAEPETPSALLPSSIASGAWEPARARVEREALRREIVVAMARVEALDRFVHALAPLCTRVGNHEEPHTAELRCDYDAAEERGPNPSHASLQYTLGASAPGRRTQRVFANARRLISELADVSFVVAGFVDDVPVRELRECEFSEPFALRGCNADAGGASHRNDCLAWCRATYIARALVPEAGVRPSRVRMTVVGGSTARMRQHLREGRVCTRSHGYSGECDEGRRVDLRVTLHAEPTHEADRCAQATNTPRGALACLEENLARRAVVLVRPVASRPARAVAPTVTARSPRLFVWTLGASEPSPTPESVLGDLGLAPEDWSPSVVAP